MTGQHDVTHEIVEVEQVIQAMNYSNDSNLLQEAMDEPSHFSN